MGEHLQVETAPGLSRRAFLKVGLAGSAALSLGGLSAALTGCSGKVQTAQGYRYLRSADIELLAALMPALLAGMLPTDSAASSKTLGACLHRFDEACFHLGPPARKDLAQLFDLLNGGLTRRLTTGVGKPWREVNVEEAEAFLQRWNTSSVGLFNAGYRAIKNLACLARFSLNESWALTGYPGPLAHVYQAVNA